MKNRAKKRIASLGLVFAFCASMLATVSFFTDRDQQITEGTAGEFDLVFEDISAGKTGSNGITSPNEFAVDRVWENKSLVSDGGILNPGDYFDLSYTAVNNGSKSMDLKQQLILNSTTAMTQGAEEYKLTIKEGDSETAITGTLSDDKKSITYDLPPVVLNGSIEIEDGVDITEQTYTVRLDFDLMADNAFQRSKVTVNYKAQAKQHRNTTSSHWVSWSNVETEYEKIFVTGLSLRSQPDIPVYEVGSSFDPAGMQVVFTDSNGFSRTTTNYTVTNGNNLTAGQTSVTLSYTDAESNTYSVEVPITVVSKLTDFTVTATNRGDVGYDANAATQNLVIPSVLEKDGTWYKVAGISSSAFKNCTNLTSIEIPSSVTTLGNSAFYGCTSLETVAFAENSQLTAIRDSAFYNCTNLTSVEIPAGVTTIRNNAFYGCKNLETVTFGNNSQLTSIYQLAFQNCTNLTSIEIPAGVTTIGNQAFYKCTSLETVAFAENSQLTSIGQLAFINCTSLTSIEIPAGVTTIGNQAFSGCTSLETVTFKGTPTTIDSNAFGECTNLTTINVPWAEGAVADAPWRATSATINYNYTG